MGGKKKFIQKLDSVFAGENFKVALYRHGNEPDMHYGYLYSFAGAPWKTQYIVDKIRDELYGSDPFKGMPGDDDVGTMSGWYVFSALGFYPLTPAHSSYVLGTPLFSQADLHLSDKYYKGNTFSIIANKNHSEDVYIQSVQMNDKSYNKTWIDHSDIIDGGKIVFELNSIPNKKWANRFVSRPYSMTNNTPIFEYSKLKVPNSVQADEFAKGTVLVTNKGGLGTATTKVILFDPLRHVYAGMEVSKKHTLIEPDESKKIFFQFPLYRYRTHQVKVNDLPIKSIDVPLPGN
jgi:hypothetical protein